VKLPFIAPARNNSENPKADPFIVRFSPFLGSEVEVRLTSDRRAVQGSKLSHVLATFAGSEIH
jgi:hypothetical protein